MPSRWFHLHLSRPIPRRLCAAWTRSKSTLAFTHCIALLLSFNVSLSAGIESQWIQHPGFLLYTNSPDARGGNRPSSFTWAADTDPAESNSAVADDFLYDGERILRVRWWGSYFPGYEPASSNFFEDGYVISFFSALPGDTAERVPFGLLATYAAPVEHVTVSPTPFSGADGHRIFEYEVALNRTCLDFAASDQAHASGFKGTFGVRYWIAIQAQAGREFRLATNSTGDRVWTSEWNQRQTTNQFWGWHTSPTNREAVSVSGTLQIQGTNLVFPRSSWRTNEVLHQELAQAFELTIGCDSDRPTITTVEPYCHQNLIRITYSEKMNFSDIIDNFAYEIRDKQTSSAYAIGIITSEPEQHVAWIEIDSSFRSLLCGTALEIEIVGIIRDWCGTEMEYNTRISLECRPCTNMAAVWSQPPGSLLISNAPLAGGIYASDLVFTTLSNVPAREIVADDFRFEGSAVRVVRWWGSYVPGVPPFFEEGYVITFFDDAETGGFRRPANALATYLTRPVGVSSTNYFSGTTNPIFGYEVDLANTWLQEARGREAQPYGFAPASNSLYWISIAAQVGQVVAPVISNEFRVDWARYRTGKSATNHFWGWYTSPLQRESLSVNGSVQLDRGTWLYASDLWQTNAPISGETDHAFELLSDLCNQVRLERQLLDRGKLVLNWNGVGYILEGAESPHGPWRFITVVSPYVAEVGVSRRFFRLACPYRR